MRLLIAEHDWALGAFLARVFEEDGYEVQVAADRESAVSPANPPDLAILDVDLAGGDGPEMVRAVRSWSGELRIVVLSGQHDPGVRLQWLEAGADDVVEKPLSVAELRARCRGLLRRRAPGLVVRHGAMELNHVERSVRRGGENVPLTNREYALLAFLLERRGEAVSRRTLLERVWNRSVGVQTNVVDVYVNYLRRKLEDCAGEPVIQTVRGRGYSIAAEA